MKKSEFTQLTQIIEHLVAKEVRKQLPEVISEVFQNMMGKQLVSEQVANKPQAAPKQPKTPETATIKEQIEQDDLKTSLRQLFSGVTKTGITVPIDDAEVPPVEPVSRPTKQYTKNPIFNQILNETTSDLRAREGLVGLAAFQGGYSPMPMAAASISPSSAEMNAAMSAEDPAFMSKAPTMPLPSKPVGSPIPIGRPPMLVEGQESNHAPLAAIPDGVSALDVAKAGMTSAPVAEALTNYSRMKAVLEASKKRR